MHDVQAITVLQAVYGQKPYWTESDSESIIEPTCVQLYAVVVTELQRYTLGVVRTALSDYPIALFDSINSPAMAIPQKIVTVQPSLTHRIRSIMGYSNKRNMSEDEYNYELLREAEEPNFPTVLFITLDEAPGPFMVNASESIPPFLQIQFVQCRDLLQRAYNLEFLPLQAIHVSHAIHHLVISLAKALGGGLSEKDSSVSDDLTEKDNLTGLIRVAPVIAGNLQSILSEFGATVKALEERPVDPEVPMADIHNIFNTLCGDYPGAVVVRHSFEAFERLVRMDRDEIPPSVGNGDNVDAHTLFDEEIIPDSDGEGNITWQGDSIIEEISFGSGYNIGQDPLAGVASAKPCKELTAIVDGAFKSLQFIEPWCKASTNNPQLQQLIKKIQGHSTVYFDAINTSIKTARDGYGFSNDVIYLCDYLLDPHTDQAILLQYIEDMQGKARQAREDSTMTSNKFREVRRGLIEIAKAIPEEMLAPPEGSKGVIFQLRFWASSEKRDGSIKAATKELHLAALNIAVLSDNVDKLSQWWGEMETFLVTAERNSQRLRPEKDNLRVRRIQEAWEVIGDDYMKYKVKLIQLQYRRDPAVLQ